MTPPVELDHVFVLCAERAPEAEALLRLGLHEGSANIHPGQGTASRRFFFENAYVELLFVYEPREAQSSDVRPTQLWERWSGRNTGVCPFGLVLRPAREGARVELPFAAFPYRPAYVPPELAILVARDVSLDEPALFFMSFGRSPERVGREATTHALPVRRITGVEIAGPLAKNASDAVRSLESSGLAAFRVADRWLMSLTFDSGGGASTIHDLRPELPLILRW